MKIHHLEVEFVGPFAGTHRINFDQFVDSKVFLIEGPTGSGKSTLLDALVFGLYGSPATEGASTNRMRSAFAGPSDDSRVRVVFETKSGIYAITRTPSYERPAKKGAARLTVQQATVLLERLDAPGAPTGETISTRAREADLEVARVVGLDRNQFRQTIILPQGEFARFLTAKSEDRKSILQSIFKTQIFARTAERLRSQAQQADSDEKELFGELQKRLAAYAGVAQIADLELDTPELDLTSEVGSYLEATAAALKKRELKATKKLRKAAARRDRLDSQYQELLTAQSWFEQREKLLQQHEDLEAKQPEIAELEQIIDQIGVAKTLQPQALEVAQRERDEALSRAQLQRVVSELDQAGSFLLAEDGECVEQGVIAVAASDQTALTVVTKKLANGRSQLTPYVQAEAEVEQAEAAYQNCKSELAAARVQVTKLASEIATVSQQREENSNLLTKAKSYEAVLAGQTQNTTQLREQLAAATEAAKIKSEIAKFKPVRKELVRKSQAAATYQHELQQARISGIAGELAQDLTTNDPCVVCGSLEHPKPAQLAADHPSEVVVNQAYQDAQELEVKLSEAQQAHQDQKARLATATALAKSQPVNELLEALSTAEAELEQAQAATADLAAQEDLRLELEARASDLTHEHTAAQVDLKGHESASAAKAAEIERLEGAIAEHRAGYGTVKERIAKVDTAITELESAAQTLADSRAVAAQLRQAEKSLQAGLAASSIDTAAELQQLLDQEPALPTHRVQVEQYRSEVRVTNETLSTAEIQQAAPLDPQSLALAKQGLESAQAKHEAKQAKVSLAAAAIDQTGQQEVVVRNQLDEYLQKCESLRPLVRLSKIVNASDALNLRGIPLETFVLLNQFKHVVDAANVRLQSISQGRFTLLTSVDKHGRERKVGLGLEILDHNTNSVRATGDISGGETFYVSLSLALGLADVVTSQSGGIELGTLLIDEGFGTLDPEVLDNVLRVVERLSDSNRSVGIVSHVEELKERISDQIQVVRHQDHTSTLRITN